jgi:subtilisin-like proprotein convertase family protein
LIVTGIAPFAGAFAPEQPLSSLFGVASMGTWTLRVTDDSPQDFGTIFCFKLLITHPPS